MQAKFIVTVLQAIATHMNRMRDHTGHYPAHIGPATEQSEWLILVMALWLSST